MLRYYLFQIVRMLICIIQYPLLRWMDTLSRETTVKLYFLPSEKESTLKGKNCKFFPFSVIYSKRKEFAPVGSKFFPFSEDSFSEGNKCAGSWIHKSYRHCKIRTSARCNQSPWRAHDCLRNTACQLLCLCQTCFLVLYCSQICVYFTYITNQCCLIMFFNVQTGTALCR